MRLFVLLGIISHSLHLVSGQCGPITATTTVTAAPTIQTISSGTTAFASSASRTFQVETCAQASLGPQAMAHVVGGTVTLSGAPGAISSATATVTSGVVASAAAAMIYVPSGGTASVQKFDSGGMNVYASGTVEVASFNGGVANLFGGTMNARQAGGRILAYGGTATVTGDYTSTPGVLRPVASAFSGGAVFATGSPMALGAGNGGTLYFGGQGHTVVAISTGTVIATGTPISNRLQGVLSGSVELTAGSANLVTIQLTGTGNIAGPNTVSVNNLGFATLGTGVTATVSAQATGLVRSGAANVIVRNSGVVTMDIGATVTAESSATLTTSGVATTITSISEITNAAITSTVWLAARVQTGQLKRAMPTLGPVVCPPRKTSCRMLSGGAKCVDIFTDIYNCGGCALDGTGVDCTSQYDGEIQCISGVCVPTLEAEEE